MDVMKLNIGKGKTRWKKTFLTLKNNEILCFDNPGVKNFYIINIIINYN